MPTRPSASRQRASALSRATRRGARAPPRPSACRCAAPGSASSSGPGRSSRRGCRAACATRGSSSAREVDAVQRDAPGDDAPGRVDQPHDRVARSSTCPSPTRRRGRGCGRARRAKLTSSTAFTTPALVKKCIRRPSTSSSARAHRLSLGFRMSRSWSATRLIATIVTQQRDARVEADPVLAREQVLEAVGDEQPDRGLGDRQAQAQERERRLELDRVRDLHRGHDDERRQAVGQQVAEARCAGARAPAPARPRCTPSAARPARTSAPCARSRPIARSTSATMILSTPCPSIASSTSAMRIAGNDSWMSAMRMMIASTQPPK